MILNRHNLWAGHTGRITALREEPLNRSKDSVIVTKYLIRSTKHFDILALEDELDLL